MGSSTLRRRTSFRAVGSHRPRGTHPVIHILIVLLVAFTMLTSGASAATILFYGQNLPTLKNFSHRFQFQNSEIRDSQGHLLYTLTSASGIRRVVEPLRMPGATTRDYKARGERWLVGPHTPGIPLALQNATVATEDATFWNNLGFDPLSIARAAYDNFTKGHVVSGASTITQQLVREYMLKDTPSYTRKAKEVILAAELTQKYQKSEILYYYLNSVPYGNQSTGAQAAAKTYFHKNVWQLDLAQAAMLAGLPEAPSLYDPVSNRAVAFKRMRYVLQLMYDHGYLVNSHGQRDYGLIQRYMAETKNPAKFPIFKPPVAGKKYPQFVQYAVSQLQNIPQLQGKLNDGLNVITTLNPQLQNAAQSIVTQQVNGLGYYNVTDGALVSMDTSPGCRGCILAMVGSADYNNAAIAGQINMANTPRQPGSSFKPFNYVYAFTHGLSPGTSVLDGPIAIPDVGNQGDGGWYEPTDYDNTWHGVVPLRLALDNSLNVPAVRVEQYNASLKGGTAAAIRETVAQQAIKMGISSLLKDNTNCCGWALTLGGLEHGVRLIQETSAYGAFATGGITDPPIAIKYVYDRTTHKLLYSYRQKDRVDKPHRVISPQAAYVMNNVLSDNAARCAPQVCEFGLDSPLYVGRPAGAKTGTTNAFTDNWTVGYTPQIVTGVWVGNANDSPMVNSTGITGAAPIWNAFMLRAFQILKLPVADFNEPSGVYLGSTCREPGPYYSLGTMETDIYTGAVPLCSIG
ncbi:MAG: transglycosylase domain-containing protein, partial [Chloroflexota bacterium]